MARPNNLTFLRQGKAIGAHRGFVETFNWLVRFCSNLRGDGVTTKVDRLNNGDNPVVRCVALGGGGGGGGGGVETSLTGNDDGSDEGSTPANPVAIMGAITIEAASESGKESNVKVITTDTTEEGGAKTGTMTIGVYYV